MRVFLISFDFNVLRENAKKREKKNKFHSNTTIAAYFELHVFVTSFVPFGK